MSYSRIGKDAIRWDAKAKVTGKADYTADFVFKNRAYGKILRAEIASGIVKSIDTSEAMKVPGVIKIITADDVPKSMFPTAGHPHSLIEAKQDIADRNILTKVVRLYGDEIAAVAAETELAAEIALSKIKVTYEEYPFYLTPEEALSENAKPLHDWPKQKNVIADSVVNVGDVDKAFLEADYTFTEKYETQIVQHCHMENQVATAYKDSDGRWVCVSSTQIPHICKRVLGQAFNMPIGKFRVIKPFIGGGFGNKQDVTIEPIVVALSMAIDGRPVTLELTREESLAFTRVRHAITYNFKASVSKDGKIKALDALAVSNNGAYASHGHSIVAKGAGILASLYYLENFRYHAKTVYTNTAAAGAMRGYGVPQVIFAIEAFMDKISKELNIDPFELRYKNLLKEGVTHPLSKIPMTVNKVFECVKDGKEIFKYDEKAKTKSSNPDIKSGVGFAPFSYATGVYPYSLEIGGCRLVLNEDGSVKVIVGATEIGQGSDTVFAQMVSEILTIPYENVYSEANTDTDTAPFDTGAYASRQTYVTGMAVEKAAILLKEKILNAAEKFYDIKACHLDLQDGCVVKTNGDILATIEEVSLKSHFDIEKAEVLTAEVSSNCHNNSYPMGATFAEVDVDTITGEIFIKSMLNVHDSGVIVNPLMAAGQVEGGMGMGVGYVLAEELKYDKKTGKVLNNNLLDYKMPTSMDLPEFSYEFIEEKDPYGPFGTKGLGEPPLCSPAGAIRNAVCNALGVEINKMPLTPQNIFDALYKG